MRILVVEDDPIIAMAAEHTLVQAGHEVIGPCGSMAEALDAAAHSHPELALVDINLAGHDEGLELARTLSRQFGIRCLFVSGQPETARANKDAAMGILQKPYTEEALRHSIPVMEAKLAGEAPPPPAIRRGLEMF